jgi:hypothetical protein
MNIRKFVNIGAGMPWHTIMLTVTGMMLSSSIVKLAVPVKLASKINSPNVPLEDIPHYSDVRGKVTARSSVVFGFSVAQHTPLC